MNHIGEKTFECEECRKKVKISDDEIPDCCGKKMRQLSLDTCLQPAHAEHARPMEEDEPCDDGRAG